LSERFPFYIGNFEGSQWYGRHQKYIYGNITAELEWIKTHTAPREIFADIGAHHGYYSLLFSRWSGEEGKTYAFECLPSNFDILVKNIALNKSSNIFPQSCAVGESEGTALIAEDSSGLLYVPKEKRSLSVPMVSLDRFFEQEKVLPTMLKIDVEGYELEVLQGAKRIISTQPKVVLEIHNFIHSDPRPRLETMLAMFNGYRTIFWQPSPASNIEEFSFARSDSLLKEPNPRLFLIPQMDKVQ